MLGRPLGLLALLPATAALGLVASTLATARDSWEPSRGGSAHEAVVELARQTTEESLLGGDLEPLQDSLPDFAVLARGGRDEVRESLEDTRSELLRRLGEVGEWNVAEVFRDDRGWYKVRVRFYPPASEDHNPKKSFRSVSYVYSPAGGGWQLRWMGFWDPDTGSWNLLEG